MKKITPLVRYTLFPFRYSNFAPYIFSLPFRFSYLCTLIIQTPSLSFPLLKLYTIHILSSFHLLFHPHKHTLSSFPLLILYNIHTLSSFHLLFHPHKHTLSSFPLLILYTIFTYSLFLSSIHTFTHS
jgi:hypothetical protein